jgi:hypothetical protein
VNNKENTLTLDDDLDSLMDKYDDNEKKPIKAQQQARAQTAKSSANQAAEQEMEYKIMTGQNIPITSTKAEEDDVISDVLEKYSSTKNGDKVLTKNDAEEAAVELME